MVTETKLVSSFPEGQIYIYGYNKPIRIDCNGRVGTIVLFIKKDIPMDLTSFEDLLIECVYIELKLHNEKYNRNKCLIDTHLDATKRPLDLHISKYENILLLGDFNAEITESSMKGKNL